MSIVRTPPKPRAPNLPRRPGLPASAPQLPKPPKPADPTASPYAQPPQWTGSDLEWITWSHLVEDFGHKIFGRQAVKGVVDDPMAADWFWQPAIPIPGYNVSGKGFRADFVSTPWGKVAPVTGYDRGIILDPRNNFTHQAGEDKIHQNIAGAAGWRVVFLDDPDLRMRPREVIGLAILGIDVSIVSRV